jgi:hypothetical protein
LAASFILEYVESVSKNVFFVRNKYEKADTSYDHVNNTWYHCELEVRLFAAADGDEPSRL